MKKSPISINCMQFYAYGMDEKDELNFIDQFPFDDRHDFIAGLNFRGIAVKIRFTNHLIKGIRRKISLSIVDTTSRVAVSSRQINVSVRKDEYAKDIYEYFPFEREEMKMGNSYRLVICDEGTSEKIAESVFHIFNGYELPHPTLWYEVCNGGIRPAWEDNVYKSLRTSDGHDYYVQFNLVRKLLSISPLILPELELRLYYPDGQSIRAEFKEPMCIGEENYKDDVLTVEFPFTTNSMANGVFYAELLCMEYPMAGFAFDTVCDNDIRGRWFGPEIAPFEDVDSEIAADVLDRLLPERNSEDEEADELEAAIDRFISEELNEKEGGEKRELYEEEELYNDEEEERVCKLDSSETAAEEDDKPEHQATLDHLTGLRAVKEKLRVYERVVRFNQMRASKALPTSETPLHAMFLGSPGTGKTTVAKIIGKLLHQAGVLSKGHVVVRERSSLLGQFYNSESEKTLAAVEEAQGGILFIDEAYQLYQSNDARDPGKFVIESLLTTLADESKRDWMLVLAGYPEEMKQMLDMNPGLKSRIPESNIYTFEDFTESELMEIAENYLAGNSYTLAADARTALEERLKADYARRDKNFGNARHVINLIQTEILPAMAVRVINEGLNDDSSLTEIQAADIPAAPAKPTERRQRIGFGI